MQIDQLDMILVWIFGIVGLILLIMGTIGIISSKTSRFANISIYLVLAGTILLFISWILMAIPLIPVIYG